MLIGASIGAEDLAFYKPLFPGNDITRIFPDKVTVSGKADVGVLPAWTDSRFVYCQEKNVVPFCSTKVDGYAAGLTHVKNQLINMPQWLKDRPVALYITDRHEPEGDLAGGAEPGGADAFKANFKAFVDMLDTLDPALRAKIKVGPILTKTWTEKAGTTHEYSGYDPMALGTKYGGDFFAVDMYHETGTASTVVNTSTIIPPATFVAKFKAYKFNSSDARPRLWPELGLVGMPSDTTGSARAAWLQGLYDECKKMRPGQAGWTQPWAFEGFIWWNQQGKGTGVVAEVGQRRDFPLDDRTTSTTAFVKLNPPLPLNKFNALWAAEHNTTPPPGPGPGPDPTPTPGTSTPVWKYWVGATMKKDDIATYEAKIPRNGMFRIFPNSNKLPPAWDDPRFAYAQRSGAVPFCSSNIDGDSTLFATMRTWIINMPQWLKDRPGVVLYLTDRHEPENNFKQVPATYLTNYTNWYNSVIKTLPADVRAKVAVGPITTLQWIVNPNNGNGNYQQYDPGPTLSDFYGIDMYMNSWKPGGGGNSSLVADAYIDPVTFLAGVKAYRYNNSPDPRPRIFPELGAIGIPADPTGAQRAAWINGLCAELDTWGPATTGWPFLGFAWWNNQGTTSPTSLTPIGTLRYFYLDKYQKDTSGPIAYADPLPLKAFNARAADHFTLVTGGGSDPGPVGQGAVTMRAASSLQAAFYGAPTQTIPPPVVVPPTAGVPATGPAASRALQAIYTVLVTDAYLNILGDPLTEWQSLQATLRWKEPGSGQLVIPAAAYVRSQIVPGCRIVVLRRVLGTQHVLIAGPMEDAVWERSDGADDNAGMGKITVTFVSDDGWLGARLSYPNPDKFPDQQTSDYWLYTGNPEQAMLKLVAEQLGRQALAARQVPKLTVAPHSGLSDASVQIVGTSDVSPREKFEKVSDVLRKICTLGANSGIPGAPVYHPDSLGFRVRQTLIAGDPTLLFEPLRSRDLSGEAHFSFGRGNLKYFSYQIGAPKATALIIGGSGTGSDAYVREVVTQEPDALAWGRFEAYRAEPGSEIQNNLKLADAAKEGFAEQLSSARLASNAADTPDQRYGVHYNVGDIVSIELAPGQFEIAPVQTVSLQAYPTSGEVVGITIGDQSARYDSPFIERFRELDRRLGRMERRGERTP